MSSWNQFDKEFDFPPFLGIPNYYMIASTPRSGSHYLAHLLSVCGDLGSPFEYFNPRRQQTWRSLLGTLTWADTFKAQIHRRVSPSGWFGLKIHWDQFQSVRAEPGLGGLSQFQRVIRIRRDDKIAQAVSFAIALQTNAWNSHTNPEREPTYDFSAIQTAYNIITEQNAQWDAYLSSAQIEPLHVTYEALVASPDSVVQSVRHYLGVGPVETTKIRPSPQRQANHLNQRWCSQYIAELGSVTAKEKI